MLPQKLKLNAWTGNVQAPAEGTMADEALSWILGGRVPYEQFLAPETPANLTDWKDPRVGWGVILPEQPGTAQADLLSNADAPPPIRDLLAHRGDAPVFRFRRNAADVYNLLRNYKAGKDVTISGSPRGTAPDALPYYLLICGSPADVPWQLQYILNTNHCVGRLDLQGEALVNYVGALMGDWSGTTIEPNHAVVWATDHSDGDITHLMRNAIADPVYKKLAADSDLEAKFLDGKQAGAASLIDALAAANPSLVVTTSHGMTGPLDKADQMKANLGLPVDSGYRLLDPAVLLGKWNPAGAIWYAHACCSAGSDSRSSFDGLVAAGSEAALTLAALARDVGARVAPLPTALLGAKQPLRAFIGHVEPTFDWTLTQPLTGQFLTDPICKALYDGLYNRQPVAYAFRPWYERIGTLSLQHDSAFQDYKEGQDSQDRLLYYLLSARDVSTAVILGDPTAALPALKPKPAGPK
jgi:hypothetical protein